MNSTIKIYSILFLAFFMSLPFALLSQEKEAKEKKVTIKTVKEVDGKKIVKDTTFTVKDEDDVKKVVKTFTMDVDSDSASSATMNVWVDVDTDEDVEWTNDKKKKMFVMSSPKGNKKVLKFKSDDGEETEVVIIKPHGKNKVIAWTGEDGEEYKFDYDFDYDFDMEDFHRDMAEMKAEMKEMQIHILDEEGQLQDELIELESLKELEHLEDLENMEVYVVPPHPPKVHKAPRMYHDFNRHSPHGMRVTDEELRDAGIKNKPDRLEIEEFDIDNKDGIIDLSFTLMVEATPKIAVYNVYGDKVFNGKPELMNNQYQLKIDLSKKQPGNYYLMIVVGNSSKTLRLHN